MGKSRKSQNDYRMLPQLPGVPFLTPLVGRSGSPWLKWTGKKWVPTYSNLSTGPSMLEWTLDWETMGTR